jgi:predicted transcriptional regulator with HTH domain
MVSLGLVVTIQQTGWDYKRLVDILLKLTKLKTI